ncbi:MAG: alpha/beta fold hydrolase [Kofleriaceae bacterium]|nr:alpha/beta fold hydrolase [Kofleriaceae bacterium]
MSYRSLTLAGGVVLAACGDDIRTTPPDGQADGPVDGLPDAEDPGVVPRLEPAACRFTVPESLGLTEGTGFSCGDLVVYENRATKQRAIRVHYIRFESAVASANATIYLDGGPGGNGQNIISYAAALGAPFFDGLRVDGDFLVIGQRGTEYALPYLDCQTSGCTELAAQYDLTAYNTAENADDVDELRQALGYEKLNVYGISYGSRLGLEVLRRHGANVRAAVIEGLVPSSVAWPAAIPASVHNALTGLHESCAAAVGCGQAYGNLLTKFSAGVASLDSEPLPMMIQGSSFELDGGTYAYVVFRALYAKSTYPWLPLVISDVAERRIDRAQSFLGPQILRLFEGGGVSSGLYNSVVCGEIFNPPDPTAFETLNAGVPQEFTELFGNSWFSLSERCQTWPRGDLQAALAQPVASSVRTLVSSGRLDPITPPGFGAIAAATLTNAEVITHANSGHGATLQSACGVANLTTFLADPTATHDLSCAADIATEYVLPAQLLARPIPHARIRAEQDMGPGLPLPRRK